MAKAEPVLIQPVNQPILCSPYEEPTDHGVCDTQTGDASEEHVGRAEGGPACCTRVAQAAAVAGGVAVSARGDAGSGLIELVRPAGIEPATR